MIGTIAMLFILIVAYALLLRLVSFSETVINRARTESPREAVTDRLAVPPGATAAATRDTAGGNA